MRSYFQHSPLNIKQYWITFHSPLSADKICPTHWTAQPSIQRLYSLHSTYQINIFSSTALCCHHRCDWNPYVGKKFLEEQVWLWNYTAPYNEHLNTAHAHMNAQKPECFTLIFQHFNTPGFWRGRLPAADLSHLLVHMWVRETKEETGGHPHPPSPIPNPHPSSLMPIPHPSCPSLIPHPSSPSPSLILQVAEEPVDLHSPVEPLGEGEVEVQEGRRSRDNKVDNRDRSDTVGPSLLQGCHWNKFVKGLLILKLNLW